MDGALSPSRFPPIPGRSATFLPQCDGWNPLLTDDSSPPDFDPDAPLPFSDFELGRQLGSGGIGVVHEADHAGGNGTDGFVDRVDRSRNRAEHGVGVLQYFEAGNVERHPSMLRLGDRASQRTYPLADAKVRE